MPDRVREQIEAWAQELIDLSRRNRSLFYRPTKRSTLEVVAPQADAVFARLMDGGAFTFRIREQAVEPKASPVPRAGTAKQVELVGSVQPELVEGADDLPEPHDPATTRALRADELVTDRAERTDLQATLKALARQAEADYLDRGVQTLYAAFGMLEWSDDLEGREEVRSPLVFVPVTLERSSPRDPYYLVKSSEDLLFNPSLVVKLQNDYGLELGAIADTVADTDSLEDVLMAVEPLVRAKRWTVSRTCVIKRSTFHKEAMYRDLLDNLDAISEHDLVRALAGEGAGEDAMVGGEIIPAEADLDEIAPPEQAHLILDADASQRRAIASAVAGASFVMDGPPGTGKSQTIANMIAELVAAGRRVLFVSEKAAALEVVANRLTSQGLEDYVFELHSHKASRKEVVQQLARSLVQHPRGRAELDDRQRRRAAQVRDSLTGYAQAVNEIREPLGLSLFEAAGRVAALERAPQLPALPDAAGLDAKAFDRISALTERLARAWSPVENEGFLWHGYEGESLRLDERRVLERTLTETRESLDDLQREADAVAFELSLPACSSFEDVERTLQVRQHVVAMPELPPRWWTSGTETPAEVLERLTVLLGQRTASLAELAGKLDVAALLAEGRDAFVAPEQMAAISASVEALIGRVPTQWRVDTTRMRNVAERSDELEKQIGEVEQLARDVGGALGIDTTGLSLGRLRNLADAGRHADAVQRPEGTWIRPTVREQVREAISLLRPVQASFHERHTRLASVFTEELYELDVATLRARIEAASGFQKLGGTYRKARAEVKRVSRSGRVDDDVVGLLATAEEALRLRADLDRTERRYAELLGPFYEQRSTDAEAVERALDLLDKVFAALGEGADLDRVAAQFTGPHPEDPQLAVRCDRLIADLDAVLRHAGLIDGFGEATYDDTLADLRGRANAVGQAATELLHVAEQVEPHLLQVCSWPDLAELVRRVALLWAIESELDGLEREAIEELGPAYRRHETDVAALNSALSWIEQLVALLPEGVGEAHRRAMTRSPEALPDAAALERSLSHARGRVEQIAQWFEAARREEIAGLLTGLFREAAYVCEELSDRLDEVEVWCEHRTLVSDLEGLGLSDILKAAAEEAVPHTELVDAVERAVLTGWVDEVLASDARLHPIRPDERAALLTEFAELDAKMGPDAAFRVMEACNRNRPRSRVGGAGIIEREAQKKRRHMPVRTLLSATVDTAAALKPCFMMSPLSVSQFLPADWRFDVVIFDEASQIPPPDAINCIYRGQQLIVAGDDRQLPPTSFFDTADDDDDGYDEGQFDTFESILGLCKGTAGLDAIPLLWHYRSRHEDLITFSNYRFYEGSLITYPGAEPERPDLGVEHVRADGAYRRGGRRDNPAEAQRVVERVLHHATEHPELSLGVVALSRAQAECIEDLVDRARAERPELDDWFASDRLDGFFVKNLENVQGDERDIIVLSVGYGPDEHGKFLMNFGPVNKDGGWRRLNVAVTRARRRVEIVSSFDPDQMRSGERPSRGMQELKTYLEYASRGVAALALDETGSLGDVESPFEAEVLRTVRSWGYEVVPQVGSAGYRVDLGVRDPERPGRYLLGIECDGAAYHSGRTARDRDRLRQNVLEGLGWRIHRIWGPAWYRHRRQAETDLQEALEAAKRGDASARGTASSARRVALPDREVVDLSAAPGWVNRYQVARPHVSGTGRAHESVGLGLLPALIREVLEVEAPVHREVIGRRVADAFRHNLTRRTQDAVDATLESLKRRGELSIHDDIIWADDTVWVRVPDDAEPITRRDAHHIPVEEAALAVHWLVSDARVADPGELLHAVKQLFGFARMGPRVQELLEHALSHLEVAGVVDRDGDGRVRPLVGPAPAEC